MGNLIKQTQGRAREQLLIREEKDNAKAYQQADKESRRAGKFFKDLPLENMVDYEAIAYAKKAGLTDPVFRTGKMSTQLKQKINYTKVKHRGGHLLRHWSKDGYWCRQNDILKVKDPETFEDTIERVNVNDVSVEDFIERYERGSRPCILTGVAESWQGNTEWQLKVSSGIIGQIKWCYLTFLDV